MEPDVTRFVSVPCISHAALPEVCSDPLGRSNYLAHHLVKSISDSFTRKTGAGVDVTVALAIERFLIERENIAARRAGKVRYARLGERTHLVWFRKKQMSLYMHENFDI